METNPCTKSELLAWCDGRRIVDLCELSKQLHCKQCSSLLDLQRTERESRYGLASVLYILCDCGVVNDVHTARTLHGNHQKNSNHSDPSFEVNVKATETLQMYSASASCILSFLALLDVPVSGDSQHSALLPPTSSTTSLAPHTPLFPSHIPSASSSSEPSFPDQTVPTSASVASEACHSVCRQSPSPPPASLSHPASSPDASLAFTALPSLRNCSCNGDCNHSDSEKDVIELGEEKVDDSETDVIELEEEGSNDDDNDSCDEENGDRLKLDMETETPQNEQSDSGNLDQSPSIKVKATARKSLKTRRYSPSKTDLRISMEVKSEPSEPVEENGSAENRDRAEDVDTDVDWLHWMSSDCEDEQVRESESSWHEEEEDEEETGRRKRKSSVKKRKLGQGQGRSKVKVREGKRARKSVETGEGEEAKEEDHLPNECPKCGKRFRSWKGLGLHSRRVHGQQQRKTAKQQKQQLTTETGQVKEEKEEEEEDEGETKVVEQEVFGHMYRCVWCPGVFHDTRGYLGHTERRHPEKQEKEKGKLFPVFLKESIKKKTIFRADGTEKVRYQCLHCSQSLATMVELAGHLRVAGDGCLSCVVLTPLGSKVRVKTLEVSMGHEEQRPRLCSVCGKVFANPTSLNTHMKEIHTQRKKFSCHLCPAAFARPGSLQYHLGTHESERDRPAVCSECGKSFFTIAHLKHHARNQHRKAPPLLCHVCGKAFYTTRTLKDHAIIHTGQRNFPCPECPMTFYKKYNLTVHQRIHSGHHPYRCAVCNVSFAQKHSLDYHMTKHGAPAASSRASAAAATSVGGISSASQAMLSTPPAMLSSASKAGAGLDTMAASLANSLATVKASASAAMTNSFDSNIVL